MKDTDPDRADAGRIPDDSLRRHLSTASGPKDRLAMSPHPTTAAKPSTETELTEDRPDNPALTLQRGVGNQATRHALAPGPAPPPSGTSGRPLDIPTRRFFETRFGNDFSGVRVHTDPGATGSAAAVSARAYTTGEDIYFNQDEYDPQHPNGQRLLAHELAHVVQQRRGGETAPHAGDPATESMAARAADTAVRGQPVAAVGAAQPGIACDSAPAPARSWDTSVPPPFNPFEDPNAWSSPAEAAKALQAYQKMDPHDRQMAVALSYRRNLARVLAALSPVDQTKTFTDSLREIGRWVEEVATRETLKKSDEQIAAEQAKFLAAQPTNEVHGQAVAPPAPKSWWGSLKADEQVSWTARGNTAIAKVVAHAATSHPHLGITTAHFRLDFPGIEQLGANVVAAGSPAMVGRAFVTTAEVNPAYVMDTVVHEMFGHPEYGRYGTEYHLKLFDAALAKQPGYTQPAAGTPARRVEVNAYAYHETEIYAVLRAMSYHVVPTAADAPKVINVDPQAKVTWHVGLMKAQWAPTLIVGILRGLRQRLAMDPRLPPTVLTVFDTAVRTNFDAATQAEVAR